MVGTCSRRQTLRAVVEADIRNMYAKNSNMSLGGPYLTGCFDDEEARTAYRYYRI